MIKKEFSAFKKNSSVYFFSTPHLRHVCITHTGILLNSSKWMERSVHISSCQYCHWNITENKATAGKEKSLQRCAINMRSFSICTDDILFFIFSLYPSGLLHTQSGSQRFNIFSETTSVLGKNSDNFIIWSQFRQYFRNMILSSSLNINRICGAPFVFMNNSIFRNRKQYMRNSLIIFVKS